MLSYLSGLVSRCSPILPVFCFRKSFQGDKPPHPQIGCRVCPVWPTFRLDSGWWWWWWLPRQTWQKRADLSLSSSIARGTDRAGVCGGGGVYFEFLINWWWWWSRHFAPASWPLFFLFFLFF